MLIQAPMRARQTPVRTPGPCFGCGGDHWLRECPDKPTISYGTSKLPPLERYCIGCGQDHFPKDCPTRQADNTKARPSQGLNYIQVIPSPNSSDREQEDISVKVITRAQAKNQAEKPSSSQTNPKQTKKRRGRKPRSKGSKKSKGENIALERTDEPQAMEPERVEVPRKEAELPWNPSIEDYHSSQTSSKGAPKENNENKPNKHMQ